LQPVAAFTSVAVRSSTFVNWSGVSVGRSASRTAAAAATCGAANEVPDACRNSSGPQSEYPWLTHVGRGAVSARGSVE
jgi:hypothetical protein